MLQGCGTVNSVSDKQINRNLDVLVLLQLRETGTD